MKFSKAVHVSGQTYTRKLDYMVVSALSGLAQSAYKMCGDIRLLASMKEIEEPFGKSQIGSSAMAYKRNPMRSERVCSLARYLIGLPQNCAHTHANQWFERTLDDSSIRRMVLPEAFLAADVILTTCINIADGLHVWPAVIKQRLNLELPFMATEVILADCVKAEVIDKSYMNLFVSTRWLQVSASRKREPATTYSRGFRGIHFAAVHEKLDILVDVRQFVGRARQQVDDFLEDIIAPILANNLLVEIADSVNV